MAWPTVLRLPTRDKTFIPSPKRPDRLRGSPSVLLRGTGVPRAGYGGEGVELTTHPPTNAEIKIEWSYGSTPPYAFFGGNMSDSPFAALQGYSKLLSGF